MKHTRFGLMSLAALSLLALTGCNPIDPLKRPYVWHESGVNTHNIAAMAANPADLTRGRETTRRRAATESAAVERMWLGKTAPLLSGGGGGGDSGGGSGGSGGAAGGGS